MALQTPLAYGTAVDYLRTVDTPTLSNAIELLNVRPREDGFTPVEVRCLFPEMGRLCGYAVTAHVETVTQMEPRDNRVFLELYEAVARSAKPAVVVFQEVGAWPERAAHCGEIMGTIFHRLGAEGLLTDSAVRDIPEVRGIGLKYFARGAVASHANFRIVRVGVPVQVLGMPVHSGDLIHGDENGVITVPRAGIERIPEAVEAVRSKEGELLRYVRSGEFTMEGLRNRIVE